MAFCAWDRSPIGMEGDKIFRWGEVTDFPDRDLLVPLPALVPTQGARRSFWGIHPPPHTQDGIVTDIPHTILRAFPMSTHLLYVCGCRDSERLQGSLVQLLQQVLVVQVSGSSTIHARVRGVTSVSPVLHEGHCTVVPSEVLHRSGVDIIARTVSFLSWVHTAPSVCAACFVGQTSLPGPRKG